MSTLPFNRPYLTGRELQYVEEAVRLGHTSGDGVFTKRASAWLKDRTGAQSALLTHSCTAALEMCALLAEVGPGDEVIMPSYTFVSTANAFVLRGATPVFVDIRPDTLNIDETLIESAITPKTRAIAVVHYAGVGCAMDAITEIARRHGLLLIEDAAQGITATYKGKPLGSFGEMSAFSFHETKNVISGEGGALVVNDPNLTERAEILREKGTDRSKFLRGAVDKYSWVDIGSSYLPSEIVAAFLWAQLEQADDLLRRRLSLWNHYHERLAGLENAGKLTRPTVPPECVHNGHLYYVLLPTAERRDAALQKMREGGIGAIFHYVPLHSSRAGLLYGRTAGTMRQTDDLSARLLRLPLFYELSEADMDRVIKVLASA